MAHKILTIGRKLGSGGRELGERVAESLGIPFFDQNLISMAAERGDLAESYLARFDEKKHNPWMYEMVTGGNKHVPKGASLQEALFKLQGDVIRHISKKTDAVIIGRCADYIIRERTDARVLSCLCDRAHGGMYPAEGGAEEYHGKRGGSRLKRSTRIAENITNSIQERTGVLRRATISIWTAADSPRKK